MNDSLNLPIKKKSNLDHVGVLLSIFCAVHCLVAPLLLVAAPVIGGFWVHPAVHIAITVFVVPVAIIALKRGFAQHGKKWILTVGIIGACLVVSSIFLPLVINSPVAESSSLLPAPEAPEVCRDCCPTVETSSESGDWTLRIPPASIANLLGGIALITAHFGNLTCCYSCREK